jgi:PAS domain S-box-containing protein
MSRCNCNPKAFSSAPTGVEKQAGMNDDQPIYSSRLVNNYVEFLELHNPTLDIDSILEYAGMKRYQVDDPGHWFSQRHMDRLHEIMTLQTGNSSISREAGRFAASAQSTSTIRKFALGFVSPHAAYRLVASIASHMTRGVNWTVKKLGPNKVQVTAVASPGIIEKPYQCENRLGVMEAMGRIFTGKYSDVEHPTCMHRGDKACTYIISWKAMPSFTWRLFGKYTAVGSALVAGVLFFMLPEHWAIFALIFALMALSIPLYAESLEKKEMAKSLEMQGDAARERVEEINIRYSHALLVQEIGQAASTVLDLDELLRAMAAAMKKHLGFDRGLLMLANKGKTRLLYKAGYGYSQEQEVLVNDMEFSLENPDSRGLFAVTFRERRPFLLDNLLDERPELSARSLRIAKEMGVQSLICLPIVYENETLGLLLVDNIRSRRPLTQTDVNLLQGVAYQIGVSITNAVSFQKLQESERKYRELVENANSIILRLDKEGNIIFFNEFAQSFFGYKEEEVLGNAGAILSGDESGMRDLISMIGDVCLQPGKDTTREIAHRKRSGERVWVAWTRKAVYDEDRKMTEVLCIGNDITPLRQAAEEKEELERRLQRAQKMEAIGTLAGGVAHDLNNILAGLVSYPELLLIDLPAESSMRKPLEIIKKSGERAAGIVQDLLTLARRGVNTSEVVQLNRLIQEYIKSPEMMSLMHEHPGVKIEIQLTENLFNIDGSPVHLFKSIMNLTNNAAEAIHKEGTILLRTENRYVDLPIRGYDDVEEGDYVVFSISDNGMGISPGDLERIFEPFYTKKAMGRSGTGLGMAVVWGTVKDHHGYIDVQSQPGVGTTFTLYFPVTRKDLPTQQVSTLIREHMGKGESILVIDDVPEQREIASLLLQRLGYKVETVASGREAVEYLRSKPADLLVLDMIMEPDMDGLQTYKKIIEVRPGQRAVIVSGFSETNRVREAQRLGVGGYLRKPYAMESICIAVRKELDR